MKKITYTKIADSVIAIDLTNGYSVLAVSKYIKDNSGYHVSFYITKGEMEFLEFFKEEIFNENIKTLYPSILRYISELLSEDKLDRPIYSYKNMTARYGV